MGKTKKPPADVAGPNEDQNLRSNKIVTKDGIVKKKILKQFTPYQCNVCKKKFTDKSNMRTHAKLHGGEQHPCSVCTYVGRTKKYLARHVRSKHGAPRHACGVCGRAFHHPCGLREHAMVHTGEKPLKCEVCGKGFRVSYSLKSHMLIHKNEKPYRCSFCAYACRDSSTLRKHEFRHMGMHKTLPCKICRKKFDSKPKLKAHITEVHLGHLEPEPKKYACEHCEKSFKIRGNMVKHVKLVHEVRPPCLCPLCGRRIKHELYLARHLKIHFPQRPYACTHAGCKKTFKDKSDLKKHSIIHAPHLHAACGVCGATFSRAHRLAAHARTHEPRASVACDHCGVRFLTKNYLIKHIRQKHAADQQRYECDRCGRAVSNKPGLIMHIKYGCRTELSCKICNTTYKHLKYLRSHYLKTHRMRYRPRKKPPKKEWKPSVEVKVEPVDPYEGVQLSLLEVNKHEIEIEEDDANLENDLMPYSNHVLSEDLQEYLLNEDHQNRPEDSFDEFLLKHVFQKELKQEPEPKIEDTDEIQAKFVAQKIKEVIKKAKKEEAKKLAEKKKKRQKRLMEKKLKREAEIMRRKKRREKFELEKVRQMYNERMRRAAAEALKKEPPKKITYFQQKITEETNIEGEIEMTNKTHHDNNSTDENDSLNDDDYIISNKETPKNANVNETSRHMNLRSDNITEPNILTNDSMNSFNNCNDVPEKSKKHETNDSQVENVANKPINDAHCDSNENIHINDEGNASNDKHTSSEGIGTNVDDNCIYDEEDSASDVNGNNDEANSTNYKDEATNEEQNCISDNNNSPNNREKDSTHNEDNDSKSKDKNDDDIDDDSDGDKSDLDGNYEPEDRATFSKKIRIKSHQCYICFKLFITKEELLVHCETHFDVCNSTTLTKCPACGHVAARNMARHMRDMHGLRVTIPHFSITTRDDQQGSKYCYKMADTVMEIIPSVKMLNHSAAVQLDRKNRERRERAVVSTRLVRRGDEWSVEKYAADVSYQEMPEFSSEELSKLPVSDGYADRLRALGRLARARGVRVLFPCEKCDKICQNLSALKLHGRRHDPNKKPFAPRQKKRRAAQRDDTPKVKNTSNRLAKPQPIKHKHKCDDELKKFYETHIRGADIEFWQFLKIYNKMDRENVQDFADLQSRTDFGIHNYGDSADESETQSQDTEQKTSNKEATSKTAQGYTERIARKCSENRTSKTTRQYSAKREQNNSENDIEKSSKTAQQYSAKRKRCSGENSETTSKTTQQCIESAINSRKKFSSLVQSVNTDTLSKSGQQFGAKKPLFQRTIMISKRQHLEREKAKNLLREKIKDGSTKV